MEKVFNIELEGTTLRVALNFELSATNSANLQEELAKYKGLDIQEIVFDASNLVFISSSGIRVIIFCSRELGKKPKIVFVNCAKEIYESFELTGIHNFITFVEEKSPNDVTEGLGTENEWKRRVEETKQRMLESYATNNDVVMYQMKIGKNE